MSTKSYTLIHHCLQDLTFKVDKKVFFPLRPKGTTEF
jgi:hypothetical protein